MAPLIFWQDMPSAHQAPLLSAVAQEWPDEVLVVTEADISEQRKRQGWGPTDFFPARLLVSPPTVERQRLIARYGLRGAVHLFTGLSAYPETYRTLKQVGRTLATVGIYVERGRDDDGIKASLRRLRCSWQALRWRQRLSFVLAVGESAVKWYARCGFPIQRIYSFGYFVPRMSEEESGVELEALTSDNSQRTEFLFVGELAPWKGVDILLTALSHLRRYPWQLEIVGEGAQSDRYKALAVNLDLGERIRWLGALPNEAVRKKMVKASILVLPSRYDGWGAVVNEALTLGTPVIVSDACGASDLVKATWRGEVVESGSVASLEDTLARIVSSGRVLTERARIRTWALASIAPEVAARYLIDVLTYVQKDGFRPVAPWLESTKRK